jgi:ribosomal protein S18 acetylase RimI-like enzyme
MARQVRSAPPTGARVRYRSRPEQKDLAALRRLVRSTGVFYPQERAVALELLEERLALGRRSGYSFFLAEADGELVGYCVWGAVPLTRGSYDLYWLSVDPRRQGEGVGQRLLELTEQAIARRGGGRLYVETSSRDAYARTRHFYRASGYAQAARLVDFYAPHDHKIVFWKTIPPDVGPSPPERSAGRGSGARSQL